MEEYDEIQDMDTSYDLQTEHFEFDPNTLCVKNIQSYITKEEFFSLMSGNNRRVTKFKLFPPKDNFPTTIGLVTFASHAESEDAIYCLNGVPPQRFILQYAQNSKAEIKNFCNPWWTLECKQADKKKVKSYKKYKKSRSLKDYNAFKEARNELRRVRRQSEREYLRTISAEEIKVEVENTSYEEGSEQLLESEERNQRSEERSDENTFSPPPDPEVTECEEKFEPTPESVELNQIRSEERNGRPTFTFSSSPDLEKVRQEVAKFAEERNWNTYHQPRNLLLALVGEVGELSELFQWKGEVLPGLPGWTEKEKEHLGQELSDVLIYLIRLSDKCHIDLPSAVEKKIALNAKKYPTTKVYGSSKKYTEYLNELSDNENL